MKYNLTRRRTGGERTVILKHWVPDTSLKYFSCATYLSRSVSSSFIYFSVWPCEFLWKVALSSKVTKILSFEFLQRMKDYLSYDIVWRTTWKNVQSISRLLKETQGMILRLILKEEQISMKTNVKEIPRKYPNEVSQELLHIMIKKVYLETSLCIKMLLTKVTGANANIINHLFISTYLTHGCALR